MKWLFTDEVGHGLVEGLRQLGEEVDVIDLAPYLEDWEVPADFPLQKLAVSHGAKIVVLVDPVRNLPNGHQFTYARGHVQRLRQRKIYCAMATPRDPFTLTQYQNRRVRGCGVRPNDCLAYLTPHLPTAKFMATRRRTAVFEAQKVLGAVQHAMRGFSYSPRRDHANWI
ncbi:MAG: hypothetical protein GY871_04560 [Actinomycetales bacterium]|nr:hypothetical protein [Actinomycetales bacterium]